MSEAGRMPASVPRDRLLALAEEWGLPDDHEREEKVSRATEAELFELAHSLDDVDDSLWEWLAGPESYAAHPSNEYVRVTDLTMAVDLARIRLRAKPPHSG
jgi:hypothetical protein